MTFEYAAGKVELHELPVPCDGHGGYAMCEMHIARVTAPVGWRLVDKRATALTLFPVAAYVAPNTAPSGNIARKSDVA